jgi:CubicO group peptidase (beta-lactamase class C family)
VKPSDRLTERLSKTAHELEVPGAALGVLHEGDGMFAFHGVTSIENPLEVDANTLFQMGSIAKTYTATAVMRLVGEGRLELDERVRTYLPELNLKDESAARDVTILNLLNHTSGWSGDFSRDTGQNEDALEKFVGELAEAEQEFPVGESVSYNNAALCVAGRVIEKIVGKPFEEALRELVLEPLTMDHTYFFANDIMTRRFAVGHIQPPSGPLEVTRPWGEARAETPAGANISTDIGDLIKWAGFHLGDGTGPEGTKVLDEKRMKQMQEPSVDTHGTLGDYMGISWILEDVEGVRVAGHDGNTGGHQAMLKLVPERQFAVAILTNANPNGYHLNQEMAKWALEAFLGIVQREPETVRLTDEQLAEYAGDYETVAVSIHLEGENGRLMMTTEAKDSDAERYPPFPMEAVTGKPGNVIVIEGLAKGLDAVFVRTQAGKIKGLHIGGRLATRID